MRRDFLTSVLLALALVTTVAPARAAVWSAPEIMMFDQETVAVNIVDNFSSSGEQVSTLKAQPFSTVMRGGFTPEESLCTRVGVAPCDKPDQSYFATLILPACVTETDQWCIESLGVRKKSDPVKNAQFIRQIDAGTVADAPGDGIPGGSTVSLWRAEGLQNSGGADTYAAYVMIRAQKNPGRDFLVSNFSAMVLPYSEKRGFQYERASAREGVSPMGIRGVQTLGTSPGCAWTESGLCGMLEDFPSETRVTMTLRISNQLTGWLMGRMADPTIEVEPLNTEQNRIRIDAEPVAVPQFYATSKKSEVTPAMQQALGGRVDFGSRQSIQANYPNSFDVIDSWKDAAKDRAAGLVTTWSASTVKYGFGSFCLADTTKLLGVVTTNAMVYDGSAPAFENGTLNYRVGGMHYNPDGLSEFQGTYDLVMRKATAQCLYGFTDAPITATVTVLESGKEQRIETSSLQELGSGANKWLKLSARGFTFSSPTLKIKLNQDRPVVAAQPQAEASATQKASASSAVKAPAKRISITCTKGKVTRKVSGVVPKCPAGFKKK